MADYLKDKQYYIDRYDLLTIKECFKAVKMFQEIYQKSLKSEEIKDLSEEEKLKGANQMLHWHLFALKASEYQRKEETIRKWMDDVCWIWISI